MSNFAFYLGVASFFVLLACVFYVIFGQVTVRKLRKNPETKSALGLEFVSGWDIVNVAMVMALPRKLLEKSSRSKLAALYGNTDLILKNTNKFDQILGAAFYWLLVGSALSTIAVILLNDFGFISG